MVKWEMSDETEEFDERLKKDYDEARKRVGFVKGDLLMPGISFRVKDGELVKVVGVDVVKSADERNYRSSNGLTVYCTYKWADGTYSCNCPGWANRGGRQDCQHIKRMRRGEPSDVQVVPRPADKITTSVTVQPKPGRLIGGEV